MRFATIKTYAGNIAVGETAGILTSNGVVPVKSVNDLKKTHWSTDLFSMICKDEIPVINEWYKFGGKEELEALTKITVPFDEVKYAPLYRNPGKIFCIGLNYQAEADTINDTAAADLPGSFYKPATSIIEAGGTISIPFLPEEVDNSGDYAKEVDGEAELVVIMGKECKNIEREHWLDYVAGFTTSIESTVIDVFNKGLRKLCISKSYDSHFAFGPVMVTPDEIDDVMKLKVRTIHNGKLEAEDYVGNMIFTPDYLVSFHSKIMRWMPGDVISTGTPKGAIIFDGDTVTTEIDGFVPITCPVAKEKRV
ncbi:MAG: fumarylacetoacetate hydrolase family protein [Cloacibacillus porcorum]|nr:fumarylacetoacetate hydrolase family protein [Cloacibacillus porcorum]